MTTATNRTGFSQANTTGRPSLIDTINWEAFLAQHDLTWNRLPLSWGEGPFIGNGMLGTIVYVDPAEPNGLRFEIGRSDVYDHRDTGKLHAMVAHCRLPIGHFHLTPVGTIRSGSARLDLWNAEMTGEIITDRGNIHWQAFASEDQVLVVEVESTPGEEGCRFIWQADEAISPRYLVNRDGGADDRPFRAPVAAEYSPNPKPNISRVADANVCIQELVAGGDYATGWRIETPAPRRQVLYVTVCNHVPSKGSAAGAARDLGRAMASGVDHLRRKHRRWWHDFYRRSFVSIPDTRLEGFYWIQMYKLGSGTRETGAVLDLLGPWFKNTGWACLWWDLNIQLTYWPMLAANHLELGEPLYRLLDEKQANLIENAPAAYRHDSALLGNPTNYELRNNELSNVGLALINLPWALHNYWLHYRHSMDDPRLREKLFPLMKRAWNLYLHVLEKKEDGAWHLPLCYSAEYGSAEDTNQDLAIIRWGCQTLLDICQRLEIDDPLIPRWQEVLQNLVGYPQDQNGLMIGKNVPLTYAHRHYSHLFPIFPFRVINADQGPEALVLMRKSVNHWLSFPEDTAGLCGFSYTGASSMMSCLGDGDAALKHLNKLLDLSPTLCNSRIQPNTLYTEYGAHRWPTIETPLSAVQSLFDMLLQSWGGIIRVFPATPQAWRDITIHNLRTEGAFLVSAVRRDGLIRFIRIESLAGEPCRVRCDLGTNPQVLGEREFRVEPEGNGVWVIDLRKGETVVLRRAGDDSDLVVSAVEADKAMCNYFGVKEPIP